MSLPENRIRIEQRVTTPSFEVFTAVETSGVFAKTDALEILAKTLELSETKFFEQGFSQKGDE